MALRARQHAEQAEQEDEQADGEEMREPDVHASSSLSSLRDSTTAPISAASSTTEASSNGNRYVGQQADRRCRRSSAPDGQRVDLMPIGDRQRASHQRADRRR